MRVLFSWELGDNNGHLARSLGVALNLRDKGVPVLHAVRNTAIAEGILSTHQLRYIQAPVHIRAGAYNRQLSSYASILLASGYDRSNDLLGLLKGWISAISLYGADVVIADHAPTAILASRILGVPAIALGSGFEIPPSVDIFPSIIPWKSVPRSELAADHDAALVNVNASLATFGQSALARLDLLFANVTKVITTFPELDHYGPRINAKYAGPIAPPSLAKNKSWPNRNGIKVFAYLHGDLASVRPTILALERVGANALCVFPDAAEISSDLSENINFNISRDLVDVNKALMEADVVITNGGAGLMAQSLLSGVPMLLLPLFSEQHMGAIRAVETGAALQVHRESSAAKIVHALHKIISERSYRDAARAFRGRYGSSTLRSNIDEIVKLVFQSAARPTAD